MNPLPESPVAVSETLPITTPQQRAPYVAPKLEVHDRWVLTTGVSMPLESLVSQLPGRSS